MKNIQKTAVSEYIRNNAENIADTITFFSEEDMELVLIFSIFRKKEKQLLELITGQFEFERIKLKLESDYNTWDVTVYFDATLYGEKYGNHAESSSTIETLAEKLIKHFSKLKEQLNNVPKLPSITNLK